MKRLILLSHIIATLTGCAFNHQSGNQALANFQPESIVKGKTTKTDLLALLGAPQTTQKRSVTPEEKANPNLPTIAKSPETWIYWSNNMQSSSVILPFASSTSSTMSMTTLAINLDENGTVMDYNTTQTNH